VGNDSVYHPFKSIRCVRITSVFVKVSAIIPVFNEEKTVAKVMETLLRSPLIGEVICINDASTDKSYQILKKFGRKIKLLNFEKNRGKGAALAEGVRAAKGEIVAFFDADLVTLTPGHVGDLIKPLIRKQARVTLGYSNKDTPVERIKDLKISMFGSAFTFQIGHKFPYLVSQSLTGERAFLRKDLLPYLNRLEKLRFGVEVFFNNHFKDVAGVVLPNLCQVSKFEKFSLREAVREYIKEGVEIAQEIGRQEKARWQDLRLLEKLIETEIDIPPDEIIDFSPLQKRINEIRNKRMRKFLKEYFVKYLNRFTSRLATFKDKLKV